MYGSQVCEKFFKNGLLSSLTESKFGRETNGSHIEIS
jgi:hypothetical protein